MDAIARQPEAAGTISRTLFVGLAMIETMAIYCLVDRPDAAVRQSLCRVNMHFDWSTFALQTVNFAILVWLLHRFLYRPVLRLVDARRTEIEKQYAAAHAAEEAAETRLAAIEKERAGIAAERSAAMTQAAAEAEEQAARRRAAAEREAAALIDAARKTIAEERERLLAEAQRQAFDLAADIARRLFAELPAKLRAEAWIERIESHLGALAGTGKGCARAAARPLVSAAGRDRGGAACRKRRELAGAPAPILRRRHRGRIRRRSGARCRRGTAFSECGPAVFLAAARSTPCASGSRPMPTLTEASADPASRRSRERIAEAALAPRLDHIGRVASIGDGVAAVTGLPDTRLDELLVFEGGVRGIAVDLDDETIGVVLLGSDTGIAAGSLVKGTGEVARVPVGEALLGRVVDALGSPLDGGDAIAAQAFAPVEQPAPAIVDRALVTRPLATGILAIDAMIPLGRGQRELIIGDRGTGKTAIAVDAIINQRSSDVICVYAAIGQKASSVAQVIAAVRRYGAPERCLFVVGEADAAPGQQWLTPYSACTMAEYFMARGQRRAAGHRRSDQARGGVPADFAAAAPAAGARSLSRRHLLHSLAAAGAGGKACPPNAAAAR